MEDKTSALIAISESDIRGFIGANMMAVLSNKPAAVARHFRTKEGWRGSRKSEN